MSFGKLGLIERDGLSGQYGLGSLAVQLGLISLQQVDPVRLAIRVTAIGRGGRMYRVRRGVGTSGPVIVRVEEGPARSTSACATACPSCAIPAQARCLPRLPTLPPWRARWRFRAGIRVARPGFYGRTGRYPFVRYRVVRDELIAGISTMAPVFDGFKAGTGHCGDCADLDDGLVAARHSGAHPARCGRAALCPLGQCAGLLFSALRPGRTRRCAAHR